MCQVVGILISFNQFKHFHFFFFLAFLSRDTFTNIENAQKSYNSQFYMILFNFMDKMYCGSKIPNILLKFKNVLL